MKKRNILLLGLASLVLMAVIIFTSCNINPFYGIGNPDEVAPSVYILYPVDGSIMAPANINIRGTAGDDEELKEVYVYVDGTQIGTGGSSTEWQIQWSAGSASLGEHTIMAISEDRSGNTATNSVDIILDFGGPSVTVINPTTNENISGDYTFSGTAADDNSILGVQISFDAQNWTSVATTSAGPTNVTWVTNIGTSNLNDGLNYIYVKALDISSNFSTTYSYFFVLNSSMSIQMISPTNGQIIGGTQNISASISGLFIQDVLLRINDENWTNLGAVYNVNYQWDTTAYSNTNTIDLLAINRGGVSNSNSTTVLIDQTIPDIDVSAPTNFAYVNDTITLTGTASDDNNLKSITMSTNGGVSYDITINTTVSKNISWSYNLNTTQFSDGLNTVIVKATDLDSKTSTESISIYVINTAPTVSISSPTNGQTVGGNQSIIGSISGLYLSNVNIRINDGSWTSIGSSYNINYSWNTASFSNSNTVEISAINKGGLSGSNNITVVIDQSVPTITMQSPTNYTYVDGSITLAGLASDDNNLKSVTLSTNGGINYNITITNAIAKNINWSYVLDTTDFSDGLNTIMVKATDNDNKTTTESVSLYVLNTSPSISISTPTNWQMISGTQLINASISGLYLSNVSIRFNGGVWSSLGAIYNINYSWDTSTYSSTNLVEIAAINKAANAETNSFNVIVDQGGPSLSITTPVSSSYIKDTVAMAGTASDDNEIASVSLSTNGGSAYFAITNTPASNINWSYNLDTTTIADGPHTLYTKAIDVFGKETTTYSIVYVENAIPSITVNSPTNGQLVNGIVNISGSVGSTYIEAVEIKTNNGPWESLSATSSLSYTWDVTGMTNTNTFVIQAINKAGTTNSNTVNIVVDHTIPTISFTSPTDGDYVKGTITLSGSAGDDYMLKAISLSTNNGLNYNITISNNIYSETTTWSTNFDTSELPEGINNLWFKVVDVDAKSSASALQINIENDTPTIDISSPALDANNEAIILESFVISGSINATFTPKEVKLMISNNNGADSWFVPTVNDFSWRYTLNFDPADPVSNTIFARTVNQVDVTNSTNFLLIVDKDLPDIFIENPSSGDYLSGLSDTLFNPWGYLLDDTGINRAYISFDNTTFYLVNVSNGTAGTNVWYTNNVDAANLSAGANTMYVKAYDLSTKSLTEGVNFTVDKQFPTITVSSPTGNTTILALDFTIKASASDDYGLEYIYANLIPKGGEVSNLITNFGASINQTFTAPREGIYTIEVGSGDYSGNVDSEILSEVAFNLNPPVTTNVTLSSDGSGIYVSGTVTFAGVSSDTNPGFITNVWYKLATEASYTMITNNTNTNNNSVTWSTNFISASYSDGTNTLMVRSYDNLSGFANFTTNIYIDNTAPSISYINPVLYSAGTTNVYGGDLYMTIRPTDSVSLEEFHLYTNTALYFADTTITANTTSKTYTTNWDLSVFDNGSEQYLVGMAIDKANHTNIVTNWIIISNSLPTLNIYQPTLGKYVSSNMFVAGMANQSNGMSNVYMKIVDHSTYDVASINELDALTERTNNFTNWVDTRVAPLGSQYLMIKAVTKTGAYAEQPIEIIVDWQPPAGSFTSPTNGNTLYGTVQLAGTATDNFETTNERVIVETNNVAIATNTLTVSSGTWTSSWDSAELPVGDVSFVLVVEDLAGNVIYETNSISIAPYISSLSKSSSWIGDTIVINGYNFGDAGNVVSNFLDGGEVINDGATVSNTGLVIPSGSTSGYVYVTVDGVRSINSNWLDLWEVEAVGATGAFNTYAAFAFDSNDVMYAVNSGTPSGGNPQGVSNYLIIYDPSTSTLETNMVYFKDDGLNGGRQSYFTDVDVNGSVMAIAFTHEGRNFTSGTYVATLTNNGTKWIYLRQTLVTTSVLGSLDPQLIGDRLFDVIVGDDASIHFVYTDEPLNKIVYEKSTDYGATFNSTDLVTGLSISDTYEDAHPDMDIDSSGYPHVVYYDNSDYHMHYLYYNGTAWSTPTVVDSVQINGLHSDLFVDDNSDLYVSYYNGDQGDLMYRKYDDSAGSWGSRNIVDYSAITGIHTSIEVSGSVKAISYYNDIYTAAYVSFDNGTGTWKTMKVPNYTGMATSYGDYSAVNVDVSGNVVVCLIDGSQAFWLATYLE